MKTKKSFTLIEMIAVVAIASALIAIFVPAFGRMMFGSKVDQAASDFKLGLEMAQAKAVSSRKYVAMVIPQYYGDADTRLRPYCDGGYRLAFVDKDGNFFGWVPDSQWRNAADGARLSDIVSNLKQLSLDSTVTDDADWDSLGSANNRKGIIFSPYGGVVSNTAYKISFTEAAFQEIGSNNRAAYNYTNTDNKISLTVNFVTGRAKYED